MIVIATEAYFESMPWASGVLWPLKKLRVGACECPVTSELEGSYLSDRALVGRVIIDDMSDVVVVVSSVGWPVSGCVWFPL